MEKQLTLISSEYVDAYSSQCSVDWPVTFDKLQARAGFSAEDFEYYFIASSLYSSKIEGNTLDVNSFFRNRGNKSFSKNKELTEIEDLVSAYKFASGNELLLPAFLKSHAMLSQTFLPAKGRGKFRKHLISVRDSKTLRPVYIAVEPELVQQEMTKLFGDISALLTRELSYDEVFYYASMLHLWLAKIHPFGDGNGRSARLLEKWFLASKLGKAAWSINSEKYYWDNRPAYYKNIALGFNYYSLHWDRCLPFLLMLPRALTETIT